MDILGQPLFYHPDITEENFSLSEEESRHCVVSLRMKENDFLFLTDGKGTIAKAIIVKAMAKAAYVKVVEKEEKRKHESFRRLVVAPPKTGERLDWLVEKAVEIGVDEIVFIETRYSERDKLNVERLSKIAISAMKQSKQVYLPQIRGMVKWKQFLTEKWEGPQLIAHVSSLGDSLSSHFSAGDSQRSILIGPEGDFSKEELAEAIQMGFVPVSLGSNVLRTETAAIYSLVCLNAFV